MKFDNRELLEAMSYEIGDPDVDQPKPHQIRYKEGWRPKLNPIQAEAVSSKAIYKLYYGERGTGKSIGALEELVQYCYEEDNCLGYIIVREIGMGTEGGAWHKLVTDILPQWVDGMGLVHTDPKQDAQTKKLYVWISNVHGGWSMIMMASLPVPSQVEGKMRGREPQIIFVDEAQTLESDTYFTSLLMQLGRRKGQVQPSKIIFACNPEGPSHWLYKRFFEEPVNQETGEWDDRYAKFHIPITDNEANLPPNYFRDYVEPAVRNDPIAYARLIKGEWVDRPDGDTLFGEDFSDLIHIRGDALQNKGLVPVVPHPIIVSYDLGAAHSSIHFKQIIPTLDKIFKLIIDEFDFVGQYMPYAVLVPKLIDRMVYWDKRMVFDFSWQHISDSSAFDQYRAKDGSFDAWDVEQISKEYVKKMGLSERYIIKMKPAPKGEHSIEARVRMVKDDLISRSLLVSATCQRTKEMFMRLPCDPENRMKPRKKSRYGHNLDSMSYGFFYFQTSRSNVPGATASITPMTYPVGAR